MITNCTFYDTPLPDDLPSVVLTNEEYRMLMDAYIRLEHTEALVEEFSEKLGQTTLFVGDLLMKIKKTAGE